MCEKLFNEIKNLENEHLDFIEEVYNIESKSLNKKGVDCIRVECGDNHAITEFMHLKSLKESAKRIASVVYLFDTKN